jgi:2-C-methyl-D-erythritol 4-phosphate cytidylyltransferase
VQIHAIVLAGGDGNRFGGEMPKQFVRLAGDPILLRTLRALGASSVDRVVVVSHPGWIDETRELVEAASLDVPVIVVAGGATRNESTRNGLAALDGADDDVVVVHDAVRPLVPLDVIQRSIEPILSGRADGTDTVIPSADTLVIVETTRSSDPERSRPARPDAADLPAWRAGARARPPGGRPGATDDAASAAETEARIAARGRRTTPIGPIEVAADHLPDEGRRRSR